MVATALILLAARPPSAVAALGVPGWVLPAPAVAIISREIAMSAFREWAASSGTGAHAAVGVNSLGKWKTATQMTALVVLLACDAGGLAVLGGLGLGLGATGGLAAVGTALLWVSAALAWISMAVYMIGALPLLLKH